MSPDSRGLRWAYVLAASAALSLKVESQGRNALTAHYSVSRVRGGSRSRVCAAMVGRGRNADGDEYHVVPDRYHISVNLLYRPENDIDATQSGQNRCCSTDDQGRKTGTILLLGPSAPIWKQRPLVSSLGLRRTVRTTTPRFSCLSTSRSAITRFRRAGRWEAGGTTRPAMVCSGAPGIRRHLSHDGDESHADRGHTDAMGAAK